MPQESTIGGELWMNQEESGLQNGLHGLQHVNVGIRRTVARVDADDIGQLLRSL